MVLGTLLAWWATRLPRRLGFLKVVPVFPIVVPSAANIVAWAFLLSPRPGYLNAQLRRLPWWSGLDEGPIDVYTLPWIIIITGFSLSAFVYLFVSSGLRNVNSELLEAAQVAGSKPRVVFLQVVLPLLRPVLLYGGGVAFILALGQFTGPLFLGRNDGIDVLTTEMYRSVSQTPIDYASAAALGSPLVLVGLAIVMVQKALLGDHAALRHPWRQVVQDPGPAVVCRRRRHCRVRLRRLGAAADRSRDRRPVAILDCRHRPVGVHARQLPQGVRAVRNHRRDHHEPHDVDRGRADRSSARLRHRHDDPARQALPVHAGASSTSSRPCRSASRR